MLDSVYQMPFKLYLHVFFFFFFFFFFNLSLKIAMSEWASSQVYLLVNLFSKLYVTVIKSRKDKNIFSITLFVRSAAHPT